MNATEAKETDCSTMTDDLQLDASGRLRHLLTLRNLGRERIIELLDLAEAFCAQPGAPVVRTRDLVGKTVANLFFEPSTRTRASFDLAAQRLGAEVLTLEVKTSSRQKGESILDMVYTLQAMHVDIFIVRDANPGVPALIARQVDQHVSIINAGEASVSHPTQGLLDLLTMRQKKTAFPNLVVAIVGDIAHSRVARSAAEGLTALGVSELRLVAPPALAPDAGMFPSARIIHDLDEGLANADVVMALRIQHERIADLDGIPGAQEYFAEYGLSQERMLKAAPNAIVMHPGPMNRGVEIESALADGESSVIRTQVTNGVAVRMAVLKTVAATIGTRS